MKNPVATIFGGSGFLGRYVVRDLAKAGWRIRVGVRHPNEAMFLRPLGDVGQIEIVQANLSHHETIARCVEGAAAVVNLVGILFESGHQSFEEIHAEAPGRIAKAAAAAGVKRFVQVSAIGADPERPSAYARSKALGEAAARGAFPDTTILRPSILFGPEDHFFNRFATMARYSPVLPLIGGGHTRMQPAYVGDVATALKHALSHDDTKGRTYELGGPRIYSFRQLMELVLQQTGRQRLLLSVPFGLAKFKGAMLSLLPNPPLTLDQVRLLERDNVVGYGAPGFSSLEITPIAAEAILPTYLYRYRRGGVKIERSVSTP